MTFSTKATSDRKYCFAVDRGGTFTDVMCLCPDGRVRTLKLLSEDPLRYSDAPREGIKRILQEVSKIKKVEGFQFSPSYIDIG